MVNFNSKIFKFNYFLILEILLHSAQAIFSPVSLEVCAQKISDKNIKFEDEDEENEFLNKSNIKNTKVIKNSFELEDDDDAVMNESELNQISENKYKTNLAKLKSEDYSDNKLVKITLHPSLNELRFTRLEWVKLTNKKEELEKIGLSSLPICEISMDAENGLNPNLFNGLIF